LYPDISTIWGWFHISIAWILWGIIFLDFQLQPLFLGTTKAPKLQSLDIKPSMKTGLVGLALSGGGARSATFNLGLLQSLAKNKVLQYCDYLSTVSGGGYIGSCLSSLLASSEKLQQNTVNFLSVSSTIVKMNVPQ
jgi:hypothetical protein